MSLAEENYLGKINSYSKEDWKPLLDLIPGIEKTEKFGVMRGGEKDKDGNIQMPFWDYDEIIELFLHIVYNIPITISFDWCSWDEGRKMAKNKNFNYDTIDIPTKCKLITAIVRNDRFCDGALLSEFKSGLILKILKSIEKQVGLLEDYEKL